MTSLEQKILSILKEDGRISHQDLAAQTGASLKDVQETIAKLEAEKVILGYSAVLNERALTRSTPHVRALVEIQVQPEKDAGFHKVAERVCRFPNVVSHYLVSGSYDFLLIVEGETLQDVSFFISSKLSPIEGVRSTVTHFVLDVYKENGVSMQEFPGPKRLAVSP